jgi:lysophospholipase L1-like esterase
LAINDQRKAMKKILRLLLTSIKWLLLAAVAVEVFCFLVVSVGNYLIYGHVYEGSWVRYDPYALFLNVHGPCPTAHNPANPGAPGQRTIWIFGGSTMRSGTTTIDATIPSYLAGLLNQPGNRPCTVLNYGENSFNSLMETKYLQKMLIEAAKPPDLIIFYDGANDCIYFAQHRNPYAHFGYRRLRGVVESYRQSFFGLFKPVNAAIYASFTKEVYDKMMEVAVPLKSDDPELRNMADLTEKRYEHVRKMAAAYGAGFLLVWQPILWVENGEVAPQIKAVEQTFAIQAGRFLATRRNISVGYGVLETKLQDRPYFLNFQNVLVPRRQSVYETDGVHLKAAGNEMVAQELGRVLPERLEGQR